MYSLYTTIGRTTPFVLIKKDCCWFTTADLLYHAINTLDEGAGWSKRINPYNIGSLVCTFASFEELQTNYPELLI